MEFLASLFGLDEETTPAKSTPTTRVPLGMVDLALNKQHEQAPWQDKHGIWRGTFQTHHGNQQKGQLTARDEQFKGQSTIRYLPYERKVVDFENRQYVQKVPVKRKVQYVEERKVFEDVPREVTQTINVAVEKIIKYHKQIVPEKTVEMVPVEKKLKVVEMVPHQRQIVHVPAHEDPELFKHKVDPSLLLNFAVQSRPVSQVHQVVAAPVNPAPVLVGSVVHAVSSPRPVSQLVGTTPVVNPVGSHIMTIIPQQQIAVIQHPPRDTQTPKAEEK